MPTVRALSIPRSMVSLTRFLRCLRILRGLMLSLSPQFSIYAPCLTFYRYTFFLSSSASPHGATASLLLAKASQHKAVILADFYERSVTKKGQYSKCNNRNELVFNIRHYYPNTLAIPAMRNLSQLLSLLDLFTWSPYGELFLEHLLIRVETISAHSLLNKYWMCVCMHTHGYTHIFTQ